ncbi:MAG: SGNH/GDSL hydrolase family protein [Victivallaceae bacterium]|nr:SGNH/GDSL hydrolase family protein [Victivallaceae bacterium]
MIKKILFQGDSITDVERDRNTPALPYALGSGYPVLVASRLAADRPEKKYEFVNRGISGNRVVDLYGRWKVDALNLKPDLISILIGVNDSWHEAEHSNGVELDRYEEIYRMLLTWTCDVLPETKLVLLEPFIVNYTASAGWDPRYVAEVPARAKIVAKLAAEFNAVFIPLQKKIDDAVAAAGGDIGSILRDGVHPAPAGHQLIADAWIEATREILK